MPNRENSADWLELALAEQLSPVSAPSELWDRVQMPRSIFGLAPERQSRSQPIRLSSMTMRVAWASAAAVLLVAALWSFSRGSQEFRSTDPLAVRSWAKDRCGLALPLSGQASPAVRLSDVRVWRKSGNDQPAGAELAFLVENRPAVLQVSRAESVPSEPGHHHLLGSNTKSVSWVAEGQLFTLACATPEDLRIACSLCHEAGTFSGVL